MRQSLRDDKPLLAMPLPLQLDVWSDIACPWCFLGKRRLARALDGRADVSVRWRAFELNPGMPPDGGSLADLERKLGGAERLARAHAHIAKLGADAGIAYAFDKRTKLSNTRLAHRAIALAPRDKADALVDAFFRAHFEQGRDISPRSVVEDIARSVGVDVSLEGDAGLASVLEDEQMANDLGIGGVPCFVANMRAAVSGAQDVDTLKVFLDDVAEDGAV
jgi:predicted DsbA family dithiol-disulfide isomerase